MNSALQPIRIPRDGLVFGRKYASATDDRISRQHVRVRVEGAVVHLEDLGSRNGTFVNKWAHAQPTSAPLPAVVRAGRTVFVVIPEIEIYEELHDGSWGGALERARKELAAVARAEQNVTVATGRLNGLALARSYCDTVGGENLIYMPSYERWSIAPLLDARLAGVKPRVVVLELGSSALSVADMATVETWLETDVRFVTVIWPGSNTLSTFEPAIAARLRERVIEVANPRYDELPYRLRDCARKHAPKIQIHPTVCEGMLIMAHKYDDEWLVQRFTEAVTYWYTARDPEGTTLRMSQIIHEMEIPPSGEPPGDRSY